ncbi:hypothetical protein W822_15440 [Advenella kashmirensis W13003]|uniref:Uncharacterized protein n=1 Tax=Advenella kashmirensis W13003 TaxID=1424334 RepID=V8QSU8_9BURK|nr:hypothetical protein [Advenella kashmirensis]ETF02410.1 hypothetical protein W822_15440 [Advenella kashmirensis W13003]
MGQTTATLTATAPTTSKTVRDTTEQTTINDPAWMVDMMDGGTAATKIIANAIGRITIAMVAGTIAPTDPDLSAGMVAQRSWYACLQAHPTVGIYNY